ncbi:MAG: flagellar motor switch protein FliN [Clostridia bacterium]|nr:flagellar motor switch protein FliN [Clostridia bacterium]
MSDFLSQEEIDALLKGQTENSTDDKNEQNEELITDIEKDALGEIGNISMGSAATTLSQLLNKRVDITTPTVYLLTKEELFKKFEGPYILIDVKFTDGLKGHNLLFIKLSDGAIIADLMMGGSGENVGPELDEIKYSALSEAMNQMIGSAATSMATIFGHVVNIASPNLTTIDSENDISTLPLPLPDDQQLVIINFKMEIENLIDSQIMQVMPVEVAKSQVDILMNGTSALDNEVVSEKVAEEEPDIPEQQVENYTKSPEQPKQKVYGNQSYTKNLDLILDVPLDVEVILGSVSKQIGDILKLAPGAIVELERMVDDPVQITVNGRPIAQGEVVVVNENFGIRITNILDPYDRINNLR